MQKVIQAGDTHKLSREERLLAALQSEWERFGEITDKSLLFELGFQSEEFFTRILNEHLT